jgi:copper(I)-binding protein
MPLPSLLGALLLTACQPAPDSANVTVEQARVTLPAVQGRPGAAYFVIESSTDARLTGLTSARAQRIELHDSSAGRMRPLEDSRIPEGERIKFAPGGRHAMIFGLDPALKVGDRLALTFNFDGSPPVTAEAEVQGPGGSHDSH